MFKLTKYGEFNSYDLLKVIAIITMIIDHIGLFFYPDISSFRVIGRISYPLFAFCIGYNQKYKLDNTLIMLAVIMCLTHVIIWPKLGGMVKVSILNSSILPSIIITRILLNYTSHMIKANNMYLWAFILWFFAFSSNSIFQYGTAGIVLTICGYLSSALKNSKEYRTFLYINLILYVGFEYSLFRINLFGLLIFIFEFYILSIILKNFSIIPINIPKTLEKALLLTSRYALIIYFVHFQIFKMIYVIS